MVTSIVHVVGARPQFVKVAVVLRALRDRDGVESRLIHTGQHYDDNMSKVFFDELGVAEANENLRIAELGHGAMTGRMLEALEQSLNQSPADWVVVYGDTNSTLAGALAAAKLRIPVAHVEAGLRSFNRVMPEEINRVVADQLSDLLLVPTEAGVANLEREGCSPDKIHLVGDVMYDSALYFADRASAPTLDRLALRDERFALVTIHRAENTDDVARLRSVIEGLAAFSAECPVVFPVHPRTATAIQSLEIAVPQVPSLHLVDPVGYLEMIALERAAAIVVTDSGGVQKEAFFAETPCVTLRNETEWVELIDIGVNRVVPPTSTADVTGGLISALDDVPQQWPRANLYGGGHAGQYIADLLSGISA